MISPVYGMGTTILMFYLDDTFTDCSSSTSAQFSLLVSHARATIQESPLEDPELAHQPLLLVSRMQELMSWTPSSMLVLSSQLGHLETPSSTCPAAVFTRWLCLVMLHRFLSTAQSQVYRLEQSLPHRSSVL